MKNSIFVLSVLYAGLIVSTGCKKQQTPVNDHPTSATVIIPSNPNLSGVLGTGHNIPDTIRLTSAITWHLNGLVYVDSSDVLMCECGAVIKSLSTGPNDPCALVIARGAKIIASGAPTCPVVFTSAATSPQPGDWGGIIILGNASSNHSGRVPVEGLPTAGLPVNTTYGGVTGTNDMDASGTLNYVRIEYAGYELSPNNEINGLTLAGVGSGTSIDYVETYKTLDDGFQFFGGTVNASHLIAVDAGDDLFETDNGYRGTIRYALGLTDTSRATQTGQSNGIESENDAVGSNATPLTNARYRYLTIIGLPNQAKATTVTGAPSGVGRYGRAAQLRRNTDFDIDSSIFMGYNFGVSIDTQLGITLPKYQGSHATWLRHSFTHAFYSTGTPNNISSYVTESNGIAATAAGFNVTTPAAFLDLALADGNKAYNTPSPNSNLVLANPFSRAAITNFIPTVLSPARQYGAFPGGVNWATGLWPRVQ